MAVTTFNRGWVAALRGDVPAALAWFDDTERRFGDLGMPLAELPVSRAEALLSVGLAGEARVVAEGAAEDLDAAGMAAEAADARAVAARAALAAGDLAAATALADQARRAAAAPGPRRRGPCWSPTRRCTPAGAVASARRHCSRRPVATWRPCPAWVCRWPRATPRSSPARWRWRSDGGPRPTATFGPAGRHRERGPAAQRAQAWYAEARARLADGDRRGAEAALRAGLRIVDEYRDSLGATELRAHASGHGERLAALGLRLAVDDGRPLRCLRWMEAWRAGALRPRPVRPPADPALADELAELRAVAGAMEAAATEGRPTTALARRLTASRRASVAAATRPGRRPTRARPGPAGRAR